MTGSRDHGLKDLFGSVPDADALADPPAEATPSVRPAPSAPPRAPGAAAREGGHGLAGLTPPAPSTAPPSDPLPSDPPSIAGVPNTASPGAPVTPVQAAMPPATPVAAAGSAPLTVVLVARGGTDFARTLDALRRQTAARLIDVLLVGADAAPDPGDLASLRALPAEGSGDGSADQRESFGARAARGVAAAGGDLVAILDDYAFPATDWAETVLEHRFEGFGALASGLGNANPRSKHSWSHMLLEYGAWREGSGGGEVEALPARNLVFRRDALAALPDLPALLEQDGALPRALAARGLPLLHEPQARLAVLNPSRLPDTLRARYAAGRLDAAAWREGLSPSKRAAKALRAALGGYARYKRDRARLFSGDAAVNPKQHGGALALAMMSEGVGRAMGFLRGPGQAAHLRAAQRDDRLRTLNKTDRRQFARQVAGQVAGKTR